MRVAWMGVTIVLMPVAAMAGTDIVATCYWMGVTIVLMPVAAMAGTDIVATCYQTCADSTHSNPEYKACVARAADRADQLLNDSYKKLQDAVRADAKDMGQSPEVQLGYLKDAQKQWIAYRDASCTFEDSLAFGGTSIGGNYSSCLCALSYERINDFERIEKAVMGSP